MFSHMFPYLSWYILSLHRGDLLCLVTHFKAARLIPTPYEYIIISAILIAMTLFLLYGMLLGIRPYQYFKANSVFSQEFRLMSHCKVGICNEIMCSPLTPPFVI